MSLEDLERAGLTLPRDRWGGRPPRSAVNRPLFVAAAALALASAGLMYLGDGGLATWIGAALFLAALFAATGAALRAVTLQRRSGRRAAAAGSRRSRAPRT